MSYSAQYAELITSGHRQPTPPRRHFDVVPDAAAPPPPRRRNRKPLLRGVFHTVVIGTCAAFLVEPADLRHWSGALHETVSPWLGRQRPPDDGRALAGIATPQPGGTALPPAIEPPAPETPPAETSQTQAPSTAAAPVAEPPIVIATVAPVLAGARTEAQPSQRPATDAASLRARAERAGLHRGLSRAILAQLTDTDFANARHAIRSALATTPDGRTFTWPASPAATRARFIVHFVVGAAETCRRYVVTIVKARWQTTALPLEKCGIPAPTEKTADATRRTPHDARGRTARARTP